MVVPNPSTTPFLAGFYSTENSEEPKSVLCGTLQFLVTYNTCRARKVKKTRFFEAPVFGGRDTAIRNSGRPSFPPFQPRFRAEAQRGNPQLNKRFEQEATEETEQWNNHK